MLPQEAVGLPLVPRGVDRAFPFVNRVNPGAVEVRGPVFRLQVYLPYPSDLPAPDPVHLRPDGLLARPALRDGVDVPAVADVGSFSILSLAVGDCEVVVDPERFHSFVLSVLCVFALFIFSVLSFACKDSIDLNEINLKMYL